MKYKIVLISGKQGSGKTTLSNTIRELCPSYLQVEQVKFAGVLYEIHDKIWEILNKYDIKNPEAKSGNLLQFIGTEFGRKTLGENVWADICRTKVDQILSRPQSFTYPLVIIDDCRFTNELQAFAKDALLVRLECSEEIRKVRCEAWRDNTQHLSEIGLDSYSEERMFDLYLDTEHVPAKECAIEVLQALGLELTNG